jgi:hypothetical protein
VGHHLADLPVVQAERLLYPMTVVQFHGPLGVLEDAGAADPFFCGVDVSVRVARK